MQEHCDFYAPNKHGNETGPQRPNLVVNLPSDRIISIDASTSLEAYLSAVESPDEETHAKEMKRHAGLVANHLADLASPSYRAQFLKKPEFIVLFLPSESFLSAALSEDPNLLERGIEQGVILATPATLVALLRSAAVGWRQDGIAEQARTISDAGRELYAHVSSLAEQVSRVGQSLDATVQDYNVAIGALQSNVLPGARKLSDLGVPAHPAQLPVVPEVTTAVRQPHADLSRLPAAEPPSSVLPKQDRPLRTPTQAGPQKICGPQPNPRPSRLGTSLERGIEQRNYPGLWALAVPEPEKEPRSSVRGSHIQSRRLIFFSPPSRRYSQIPRGCHDAGNPAYRSASPPEASPRGAPPCH